MNEIGLKMIFDGWAPVIRTLVLGSLSYVSLVMLLRISGKRTLSKMNAFDLVVTVAFGSTLASIMTSSQVSLVQGVLALGLLVLLQLINTFLAVRYPKYQALIKAQPTLIFFNGQFLVDSMRKQRVSREEVLAAMRQHGVAEPSDVDAVVIETEGSLSVMTRNASSLQSLDRVGVSTHDSLGERQGVSESSSH
ncbi:DUF421 domain-containing protein [Novipirellula caenicola]|uniref:DUF421 domain-containing protein n=1 Tax=Novipirellula caenicola TaxID=1536901 RepID=A0ABP9VS13_9BACT